jgi:hypothetical protein
MSDKLQFVVVGGKFHLLESTDRLLITPLSEMLRSDKLKFVGHFSDHTRQPLFIERHKAQLFIKPFRLRVVHVHGNVNAHDGLFA